MTAAPIRDLMVESLGAWHISARVEQDANGAVTVTHEAREIRIEPAPPELPFRWLVIEGGRRRGAVSLVAVLRQVRGLLDPGYAMTRVRIATSATDAMPAHIDTSRSTTNFNPGGRTS